MITKTTPITAAPFNEWQVLSLTIATRDGKTSAVATLVPSNGTQTLNAPLVINIPDVLAAAATTPQFATAVQAVQDAIAAIGTARGVL